MLHLLCINAKCAIVSAQAYSTVNIVLLILTSVHAMTLFPIIVYWQSLRRITCNCHIVLTYAMPKDAAAHMSICIYFYLVTIDKNAYNTHIYIHLCDDTYE